MIKQIVNIDPPQDYLWLWIPARGRSGGILIGTKIEKLDVGAFHEGKYMLQLNLWDKELSRKWNLINVYGAAQEEDKEEFLAELSDFCMKNDVPYIVGGDFNIIRYSFEKIKKFHPSRFIDLFNSIITTNDLREIEMSGGKFTWTNNQENPTLVKLDRILMPRDWESLFPLVRMYKRVREMSDHNPLILSTLTEQPEKKIPFHFELSWMKHPDFLIKVEKIWNTPTRDINALDRVQFKLKSLRNFLRDGDMIELVKKRKES